MGPPEAPRAVSVGLRNCYLALSEAPQAVSIGLRNCYLARVQLPLKLSKPSKPSQQLSTAFRCFAMGPVSVALRNCYLALSEAPQAVSIGLRNCYLARVQLPLKLSKPSKPSQQLSTAFRCFAMTCFCWASKLLSGTSEAPQTVSIGLRNCYLARFQHPLKPSKPSKPSQQLSTAFRCFAMGPPEAPQALSVGLRNCYLALPKRHKLFLLGFETAIWHVFSSP